MKVKSLLLQSIAQIYDLRPTRLRLQKKTQCDFFGVMKSHPTMQWKEMVCLIQEKLQEASIVSHSKSVKMEHTEHILEPHEAVGMIGTIVVELLPENQEEPEILPDDKDEMSSHKVQQSIQ